MLYQDFSETTSRRPVIGPGARVCGLHAVGAACAIGLLIAGIYVTSRYVPYEKMFNGFTVAMGFLNEDEPSIPSRGKVVAFTTEAKPTTVASRVRRRVFRAPAVRPRLFTLPPLPQPPHPEMAADLPVMAAVYAEPAFLSFPEHALPPRPRNPIVRVLTALSFPFRFLGGVFGRRAEPAFEHAAED